MKRATPVVFKAFWLFGLLLLPVIVAPGGLARGETRPPSPTLAATAVGEAWAPAGALAARAPIPHRDPVARWADARRRRPVGHRRFRAGRRRALRPGDRRLEPCRDACPAARRFDHTATPLRDGRVLVVGGRPSFAQPNVALASALLYDPSTNEWTPTDDLPPNLNRADRARRAHGDAAE